MFVELFIGWRCLRMESTADIGRKKEDVLDLLFVPFLHFFPLCICLFHIFPATPPFILSFRLDLILCQQFALNTLEKFQNVRKHIVNEMNAREIGSFTIFFCDFSDFFCDFGDNIFVAVVSR